MAFAKTSYNPGSVNTATGTRGGGGSMLDQFVQRRMAEFEANRRKQQASASGGSVKPGGSVRLGGDAGATGARGRGPVRQDAGERTARQEAMRNRSRENVYRERLRQIDLQPPMKFITGGPGILAGWAPDTSMLPVSMRPGNAQIVDQGTNFGAGGSFEDFENSVQQRRAIDRTGGGYVAPRR